MMNYEERSQKTCFLRNIKASDALLLFAFAQPGGRLDFKAHCD